ncbi:hypothetical protein HPB50_019591 [Hyalomma asiaticum]|uniref:Uncharacterized protein n=1 Tax=Hyalomma asiaticum TaxID=266040 RepID=A0ACB7TKT6_HYAAI|nr:hypothetical protein HPB50_019591 [Hyalomma asiaticum]
MASRTKGTRIEESDASSDSASSASSEREPGSSGAKSAAAKQPKMIDMIIEAMKNMDDRKGATPIYIKKFILGKYPEMDTRLFKAKFKRTFTKAIENSILVRTKATEHAEGVTGRVRLATKMKPRKKLAASGQPSASEPPSKTIEKKAKGGDASTIKLAAGEAKAKKGTGNEAKSRKGAGGDAKVAGESKAKKGGEPKAKYTAASDHGNVKTSAAEDAKAKSHAAAKEKTDTIEETDKVASHSSEEEELAEHILEGDQDEIAEHSRKGEEEEEQEVVKKPTTEGEEAADAQPTTESEEVEERAVKNIVTDSTREGEVKMLASEDSMADSANESDEEPSATSSKKSRLLEAKPATGAKSKASPEKAKRARVVKRRGNVEDVESSLDSDSEPSRPRPKPARRGKK